MRDKLVAKSDLIDTNRFDSEIEYNTDKLSIKNKIGDANEKAPDTMGLVKKADYDVKIFEIVSLIQLNMRYPMLVM